MIIRLLRFFFLVAAVWIVWISLRQRWRQQKFSFHHPPPPIRMVRCAHCGIHLPQNEAVEKNHLWYCNAAVHDRQ